MLIVFLLYFPAIDANNSGKKKWLRRGFYLYCWNSLDGVEEVQGQIANQGKLSFDLLLFILLVVFIVPLYTWLLVPCVMFGPLHDAYLLLSM